MLLYRHSRYQFDRARHLPTRPSPRKNSRVQSVSFGSVIPFNAIPHAWTKRAQRFYADCHLTRGQCDHGVRPSS